MISLLSHYNYICHCSCLSVYLLKVFSLFVFPFLHTHHFACLYLSRIWHMCAFTWRARSHGRLRQLRVSFPPSTPGRELSHPPDLPVQYWPRMHPDASVVQKACKHKQVNTRKGTDEASFFFFTAHVWTFVCMPAWQANECVWSKREHQSGLYVLRHIKQDINWEEGIRWWHLCFTWHLKDLGDRKATGTNAVRCGI